MKCWMHNRVSFMPTLAAFALLACGARDDCAYAAPPQLIVEYNAEGGVTPVAAGWTTYGPVSGSVVSSGGVPGLGQSVWRMACDGAFGSYLFNLDGLAGADDAFRFTATVRHLQTLPQNGTDSCAVVRNRPGGAPGLPQALGATSNGQWYRVEAIRRPGSSHFVGAQWLINHTTGTETLVGTWSTPFVNTGSPGAPGASAVPNSIAMACGNNGSSYILGEFDNVRLESIDCGADYNLSGSVTVQDLFDFLAAYFGGDKRADFSQSADPDGNFAISVQDIFDFLAAYFAGCP